MKINFEAIQDAFPPGQNPVVKGPGRLFCLSCKKTLDEKSFFKTNRTDKFATGYLPHCKTCVTMTVQDTDPSTFLPLLKDIDVAYIPIEWRQLLAKKDRGAASIIGKYLSKMRLNNFKKYRWIDSERLMKDNVASLLEAMRQETQSESEAEEKVEGMLSFSDIPNAAPAGGFQAAVTKAYGLSPESSKYGLNQEEINNLKLAWGPDYTEEEYLNLEQLFSDMKAAYVIQDPIAISNAKMICKMTIKMNKFLDIDDVESAAKISRQLDLFIKTANLAPIQQKDRQQTTFAISQLAFYIEKEGGFIPKFDLSEPLDKIDMILQDMKEYTEFLVRGEKGLGQMLDNTEAVLAQESLPELENYDDFAALEAELLGDMGLEDEGVDDAITD